MLKHVFYHFCYHISHVITSHSLHYEFIILFKSFFWRSKGHLSHSPVSLKGSRPCRLVMVHPPSSQRGDASMTFRIVRAMVRVGCLLQMSPQGSWPPEICVNLHKMKLTHILCCHFDMFQLMQQIRYAPNCISVLWNSFRTTVSEVTLDIVEEVLSTMIWRSVNSEGNRLMGGGPVWSGRCEMKFQRKVASSWSGSTSWWRRYVPPKRRDAHKTTRNDVAKAVVWTVTDERTSSLLPIRFTPITNPAFWILEFSLCCYFW